MDYNPIAGFLEKFKTIFASSEASYGVISEIITKHTGFPVEVSTLKIKGAVISIQGSPFLKSEILIHKQGILSDLASLLPTRKFTDIK